MLFSIFSYLCIIVEHEWCTSKAQINGSLCHITASFGMAIAGIVINDIIDRQMGKE